jgi:hypothetical protein
MVRLVAQSLAYHYGSDKTSARMVANIKSKTVGAARGTRHRAVQRGKTAANNRIHPMPQGAHGDGDSSSSGGGGAREGGSDVHVGCKATHIELAECLSRLRGRIGAIGALAAPPTAQRAKISADVFKEKPARPHGSSSSAENLEPQVEKREDDGDDERARRLQQQQQQQHQQHQEQQQQHEHKYEHQQEQPVVVTAESVRHRCDHASA